jgi:uncharacterized membrane protein YhaH (DUF805 family)
MKLLKRLFSGRIGRANFFIGAFFTGTFLSVLNHVYKNIPAEKQFTGSLEGLLLSILILMLSLNAFSLVVKRWHDLGKSGFWAILSALPVVNVVVFIYLIFKHGELKQNKYGKVPERFML